MGQAHGPKDGGGALALGPWVLEATCTRLPRAAIGLPKEGVYRIYIYIRFRLRPANLLESIEKSDLAIENPHAIFAVRYFQETY